MDEKSRKDILNFALDQLKSVMEDLKNGKNPTFPQGLKKVSEALSEANQKVSDKNLSEKEMKTIVDNLIKKVKPEEK
jgi:hypothetical protein